MAHVSEAMVTSRPNPRAIVLLGALALLPSGCLKMGKSSGTRDSGQSRLMDQSFAGQNRCNPENHDRPFVIEWDATDMSNFEAHAANDIVVVRYEGCSLKVLDECRNDSIRGEQGAYKPPEWTSGSLETIDISNEGELYAKLPLGQATLGGRVSGGEQFHMEYYVAGTRSATRDAVYAADLASNPGCEGATHFVYAYNLGSFALASKNELQTQAGGSMFGFGAGGQTKSKNNAEKKGGDLAACKSDSATEVQGCKTPIRLSLRKVRDGENPDQAAQRAPDTDASLNAAGMVAAKVEMSAQARAHYDAAVAKMNARDGKGCLAELDMHAKLDPDHPSTDPKQPFAINRANCLMLAGKCDAGKDLLRKAYGHTVEKQFGPETVDRHVEAMMALNCQGKMSERETVLQALQHLQQGAYMTKKDAKFCETHWATIKKLRGKVKPKDDEDTQILHLDIGVANMVPNCFGRAGACDKAWSSFQELELQKNPDYWKSLDPKVREQILRNSFGSSVQKCKDQ